MLRIFKEYLSKKFLYVSKDFIERGYTLNGPVLNVSLNYAQLGIVQELFTTELHASTENRI